MSRCAGRPSDRSSCARVTFVSMGEGNDIVRGGPGADYVEDGRGSRDFVLGAGDETVDIPGGTVKNEGRVDAGSDQGQVIAGPGNDRIHLPYGGNVVYAGPGDDDVLTGNGSDVLVGGSGRDWLYSGGGDDRVFGGTGNDGLYDEPERYRPPALRGDDVIKVRKDIPLVDAGRGDDTLYAEHLLGGRVKGGSGRDAMVVTVDSKARRPVRFSCGTGDDRLFVGPYRSTTCERVHVCDGHVRDMCGTLPWGDTGADYFRSWPAGASIGRPSRWSVLISS